MIFGRVQRRSFMWIGGSGSCVLPRYGTHAVPHMPAIAMAFGCNHLMSLAFEVDREYTAEVAAELAKPAAEREPLPLLTLTAEDRAMDAAMYVVKYTSKPIKPGQAQHLLRMLDLMQSYMLQPVRQEEDAPTSGIGNVMVVLNRLGSSIAVGMSMVAFKLAGLMTFTSTAITVPLPVSAFAALALASTENALDDDDAEEGNTTTLLVEGATANTFHAVTQIDHYQLRGDVLCTLAMSPYMLFSLYELRRLPPSAFKPPRRQRAAGARRRLQRLQPSSHLTGRLQAPLAWALRPWLGVFRSTRHTRWPRRTCWCAASTPSTSGCWARFPLGRPSMRWRGQLPGSTTRLSWVHSSRTD